MLAGCQSFTALDAKVSDTLIRRNRGKSRRFGFDAPILLSDILAVPSSFT